MWNEAVFAPARLHGCKRYKNSLLKDLNDESPSWVVQKITSEKSFVFIFINSKISFQLWINFLVSFDAGVKNCQIYQWRTVINIFHILLMLKKVNNEPVPYSRYRFHIKDHWQHSPLFKFRNLLYTICNCTQTQCIEGAIDVNFHLMNLNSILTFMITNLECDRPQRPFQDKGSHGIVFYQNHNYQLNPAS